jgi:hypothetical protein
MDTNALKKFAQAARNLLIDQVRSKLDLVIDPASPARSQNQALSSPAGVLAARERQDQSPDQA